MTTQKDGKLNWLQRHLPEGLLVDAAWLERHGYSGSLRSKYVAHGWLNLLARGVYRRPTPRLPASQGSEPARWQQLVISLQELLGYPLHVGARTALEHHGFAHYLAPHGPREIHLYGDVPPPGWLSKLPVEARFICHRAQRLFPHAPPDLAIVTQPWGHWDWPLRLSSPERAILELLDELPGRESFHQVDVLMDGLNTLSPRRLHALLTACRNVKVKRLFLWFAERHSHGWLKALRRSDIDLGRGKRLLVRGGKLDTQFNITVPDMAADAGL